MTGTMKKILSLLMVLAFLMAENTAFAEQPAASEASAEQVAAEAAENSGIIDAALLNQWADDFATEHQLTDSYKDFSIGFCYTGTGDSWYYNADVWMYSASMYKVPVSMLLAEKVASGELTQQSTVSGITVEYAESTALVYSNNDSGHAIVSYLGGTYAGKCSDQTEKYTDLPSDYFSSDFIDVSYYTARYMTQVMKTLYDGGEEKFPHVIEYLLQAQPGAYFRLSQKVESSYQVAQKFGAYEEPNGNNNNHCTAIIYTPTPIIVTVMTRNVMDYQNIIAQVGEYLADYSLERDQQVEAWRQAETERAEAEALALEQTANDAEPEMQMPETESIDSLPAMPDENPDPAGNVNTLDGISQEDGNNTQKRIPTAVIIIAAVLAAVIIGALILLLIARKRAAEDETMAGEELDWTDSEPVGKTMNRRRSADEAENPERGVKKVKRTDSTVRSVKKRGTENEYKPRH